MNMTWSLVLPFLVPALVAQDAAVAKRLQADIAWLAGPETQGRGHGQEGLEKTARFLEAHYRGLGVSVTRQPYEAKGPVTVRSSEVLFGGKTLTYGQDIQGPKAVDADLKAVPTICLGLGQALPPSLEGKVAVLLDGEAEAVKAAIPEGDRTLAARAGAVARLKPAALILVPREGSKELTRLSVFGVTGGEKIPTLLLPEEVFSSAVPGSGDLLAGRVAQRDLPPTTLKLVHETRPITVANVVATIPGRDPKLKDEYLLLSAHYDHLGTLGAASRARNAQDRKKVHPGADDNASGTAVVMDLARRLAKQPTRRSIVLLHVSGEEVGLLGSVHWADHPTVPLGQVRCNFNFDMVGRMKPTEPKIELGTISLKPAAVARLDAHIPKGTQVKHDIGMSLMSSDHASFAPKRIPVAYYSTGDHPDYHLPEDTADRINSAGAAVVEDAAYAAIREIGDADQLDLFDADGYAKTYPEPPKATKAVFGAVGADEEARGLLVDEVKEGSPAAALGLRAGDVLASFHGRPIKSLFDLNAALAERKAGDRVKIQWYRGAQPMEGEAVLKGR